MDADIHASSANVTLEIDGVTWARVPDLRHSGPEDRHYVADVDPVSAATSIVFGDGVTGKRPPSGVALVVTYRSGAGSTANPRRDGGRPLQDLLELIQHEVDVLEEDLEHLYDDLYVEAEDAWVIPYLDGDGRLLGRWIFSRAGPRRCLCFQATRGQQRREA